MQETSTSAKNREHNKRKPRDEAPAPDAPAPPAAPAPPGAPPNEADLFGDDDEASAERPLRDGTGVPAPPSVAPTIANSPAPGSVPGAPATSDEEVEAFAQGAQDTLAEEEAQAEGQQEFFRKRGITRSVVHHMRGGGRG